MSSCDPKDKDKTGACAEDPKKKALTTSDDSSKASDAKGAEEEDMDKGASNVSSSLEEKDLKGK